MGNASNSFYPIIYVRGFAATRGEMDETAADPFCGFNLGSTVYRAVPERDRKPRKFIFESTVVRLASDFEYQDVYEDGYDIVDADWHHDSNNKLKTKSIIIYRYYDEASSLLGDSKTPSIVDFAKGLSELILKVRNLIIENTDNNINEQDFKCYLVAHSMGGLVCRAMLQNPENDICDTKKYVDKFFTYATPHDGIELGGFNVPSWMNLFDISNFSRKNMAKYLNLQDVFKKENSVALVPSDMFPAEKIFCMVGTNRSDYEVAMGASRTFAGHGSDGLVRVENATLSGINKMTNVIQPCAKAFAYRSHSGYFGIVNSEESYQNLTRFLFGNVRVDIWLEVNEISLPKPVQVALDSRQKVNALYQIEAIASPRGKLWSLTRRIAEEDSVACFTHEEYLQRHSTKIQQYLSSVFLADFAKVNPNDPSLAYSLYLGIKVPDYEIEKKIWVNEHYEGTYLFRNTILLKIEPPSEERKGWAVKHSWQNSGFSLPNETLIPIEISENCVEIEAPFETDSQPGIKGRLILKVSSWNK